MADDDNQWISVSEVAQMLQKGLEGPKVSYMSSLGDMVEDAAEAAALIGNRHQGCPLQIVGGGEVLFSVDCKDTRLAAQPVAGVSTKLKLWKFNHRMMVAPSELKRERMVWPAMKLEF